MKINRLSLINAIIVSLSAITAASADIKITTRNTVAGHSSQGTTYIKGARQRTDAGVGIVSILQCDLKRTIQINDNGKTYMITPLDDEASPTPPGEQAAPKPDQPARTRRGGVVTYTTTTTDTGERKQMFGFTARHIKTSMSVESSPDACNPTKLRMDTDGWYIDLQYGIECSWEKPVIPRMPTTHAKPECQDEVRFKRAGAGRMGYPLVVTTTMYGDDGRAFTTTTEVVELSTTTLDAALFEPPAGYREVNSFEELAGMPSVESILAGRRAATEPREEAVSRPIEKKQPGVIRVGVVAVSNKTDGPVETALLRDQLIGDIRSSRIDAVPLDSRAIPDIEAEARQKDCDYILYTDIAELKKSAPGGKVGGLLGRASGVLKERYEARSEFRLFPVGSATPQLASSASAKEDEREASLAYIIQREAKTVVDELRKRR
ncbi:MAG TPA: hypothetical protein VJH03_21795 [Blastocatellia bacterium]|nr:hypothetical protein [Blastocatellia bacterium]